ncbi:MAG: heparinase II/III family protein [Clostridia bacterium]|nr:heparinase II/III family protein [Clostridia bacterium]
MMEPILQKYIPDTASLILPWQAARLYADLPPTAFAAPDTIPAAESLLGKPIPALPASLYRQFYENGNRSNYEGPYFERRKNMLLLAAAEKTEGKGRFLDLLVDYIWAVCEETSWVIPAHNTPRHGKTERLPDAFDLEDGDDIHYIDLFAAATGADVAMVWHLLHDELDALTPVVTRRMLGLLEKRIFHPFTTYQDSMWWKGAKGNTLNNWTPWIVSNVLTAMMLCEKDTARRTAMTAESMTILDRFIGFYKNDGGCDEGPGYWTVAGASYFDCLEILWDLSGGKIDVFDVPLVRRMGEYIADVHITGNLYVNFADAAHRIGIDAALIARYGRRTDSPRLNAFACELAGNGAKFHNLPVGTGTTPYRSFRDVIEPMPEMCGVQSENPTAQVDRTYYDGLEIFLARDPASGLFLACKGGHNAESHNHNDVGNIVVFRGVSPVFIDAGVERYTRKTFSSERYTIWTMRSRYHNLPDIGGTEQKPGGRYHAALAEQTADSVTYDLRSAWPEDAGIAAYTRCAAMDGSAVTVTDSLTLTEEAPVCWYWMCAEKPAAEGNTLVFPEAGCRVTFSGGSFTLEVEPFPLTDDKLTGEWKTDTLWRVHLQAEGWKDGSMQMTVLCD